MVEIVKNLMRIKTYEPSYHFTKIQQTSEKYQACLNIFPSECSIILSKDSNKRARNIQLA